MLPFAAPPSPCRCALRAKLDLGPIAVLATVPDVSLRETGMTATGYSLLATVVFAIVAALQAVRAALDIPITIGDMPVPMLASWIACGVATVLATLGYMASKPD